MSSLACSTTGDVRSSHGGGGLIQGQQMQQDGEQRLGTTNKVISIVSESVMCDEAHCTAPYRNGHRAPNRITEAVSCTRQQQW